MDLDAIVPEKLRRRALEIAAELDGNGFELPPILAEAAEVYRELQTRTRGMGSEMADLNDAADTKSQDRDEMTYADGLDAIIGMASGKERLHMALYRVSEAMDPDRIAAEVERSTD